MRNIGAHHLDEEGDLIKLEFRGDVMLPDIQQILSAISDMVARQGTFGVLVNAADMGTMTPEARRFVGSFTDAHHGYGAAVLGASLPVRAVMTLVTRAVEIFHQHKLPGGIHFFQTEAEARAWLDMQRKRFLAK